MKHKSKLSIYGSIALFHGIVIWFYRFPFPDPRNMPPSQILSPVIMASGTEWDAAIKRHPMVRDPLLMARANTKGYTGELWNQSFGSPNPYNDWEESPRYLEEPEGNWGQPMLNQLQQESRSIWKPLTKPLAIMQDPTGRNLITKQGSHMVLSANLRKRYTESMPDLPPWEGSTLIRPTRLQIAVDHRGVVQSVRRVDPPSPDPVQETFIKDAILRTKQLRFQRRNNVSSESESSVEWGEIEFKWGTTPPGTVHPLSDTEKGKNP